MKTMDASNGTANNDGKLFLPVPNLKLKDLLDWQDPDQREHRHLVQRLSKGRSGGDTAQELRVTLDSLANHTDRHRKCFGEKLELNDEIIALFRIGNEAFATQATCPHAGGPLYLADIEELVPGHVCLKCPWHKWTFDIDSGCSITPPGRNLKAKTFPVQVAPNGDLKIGFDSFGPSAFSEINF